MGYYAYSTKSDFLMLAKNQANAVKALHDRFPGGERSDKLEDLLAEFGFTATKNKAGDIDEVFYEYQKFHSDDTEELLCTIAPFVEAGSYIAFQGEDDSLWAYYFDGNSWEEHAGVVDFPGMPTDGPKRHKNTIEV